MINSKRNTLRFKLLNSNARHSVGAIKTLILLVLVFVCAGCQTHSSPSFEVGTYPPDFTYRDLQTQKISKLSDLRGKTPVVLHFWASWCDNCKDEFPLLNKLYSSEKDITILSIAVLDKEEDTRKSIKEYGLHFLVGFPESDRVSSEYHISGVPESIVLDTAGKIMLITDPRTGAASSRIIGGFPWTDSLVIQQLEGGRR